MVVIVGAVVGFAASAGRGDLGRERRRPLAPGEVPSFRELDREREGMGLPRLGKDRLGLGHRLKRAPDSFPRDRGRRHRGPPLPRPTIRSAENRTEYRCCGFSPWKCALLSGKTWPPWSRSTTPTLP